MAAATADQLLEYRTPGGGPPLIRDGVVATSKTLYQGTLAFTDAAAGTVTDVINSGANPFFGLVREQKTAGETVTALHLLTIATLSHGGNVAATDVGAAAYASNNNDVTATAGTNTKIGLIVKYISATECEVLLGAGLP